MPALLCKEEIILERNSGVFIHSVEKIDCEPGTGAEAEIVDPTPIRSHRFYRVEVIP